MIKSCPESQNTHSTRWCARVPHAQVAKYCGMECQNAHWAVLHCRFCGKLSESHLKHRFMASTAAATLRQSKNSL